MPITGTFYADFTPFSSATKKAADDLRAFESTTKGTVSSLTNLEKATTTAAPQVANLHQSWQKFDGALAAAGIHIGPEIRALEDLGGAAGKTAGELGLLATAGLTLSAAIGGWKIGRMIADFTGSDKIIGDATAKLLGWGDAAAQVAGAQQDAINLAFQRTGVHARDAAEALRLNTEWAKTHTTEAKAAAEAQTKWAAATADLVAAGDNWRRTLRGIDGDTINAIKYYLDLGVAQKTLATAYGLTDIQVKAVAQSLKEETQAAKDAAKATAEGAEAIKTHWAGVGTIVDDVLGVEKLKKATAWTDAIAALGGNVSKLSNEQLVELQAAMQGGIAALGNMGQLTSSQSSAFAALMAAASAAIPPIKELTAATAENADEATEAAQANDQLVAAIGKTAPLGGNSNPGGGGTLGGTITQTNTDPRILMYLGMGYTLNEALAIAGGYGAHIPLPSSIGRRAAGGPVGASGAYVVGERGPELFTPGVSGTIAPSIAAGGSVQIVINGSVLSTQAELAALVERAMLAAYRRGGSRLPA